MRVFVGRLVSFRRGVVGAAVVLGLAVSAAAQPAPDFDAVAWTGIGCPAADLVRHTTPAGVDLAGDATFPAIYIAHDADYAYSHAPGLLPVSGGEGEVLRTFPPPPYALL